LFRGPGQHCPSKELKIKVLQDYLKVASRVLSSDPALSKPTLWHGDLHAENIFVDPSDPTKVSNIID
jgi:Ser/Thr protein kinase RdoA (MazF antagonist)